MYTVRKSYCNRVARVTDGTLPIETVIKERRKDPEAKRELKDLRYTVALYAWDFFFV